jgi:hypothetical protein
MVVKSEAPTKEPIDDVVVQEEDRTDQVKENEVQIVFDQIDSSKTILKNKAELKKEKKRKKREAESLNNLNEIPSKKKKKLLGKLSGSISAKSEPALVGETIQNGDQNIEEEFEHPSLAPVKKPPKKLKKTGISSSLMPRIKALSNKSFSFKPK